MTTPQQVPAWRRGFVLPFAVLALVTLPIFGVLWGLGTLFLGVVVILGTALKGYGERAFKGWLALIPLYGRAMLAISKWCGHVPEEVTVDQRTAPPPSTPPSSALRTVIPHTDGH